MASGVDPATRVPDPAGPVGRPATWVPWLEEAFRATPERFRHLHAVWQRAVALRRLGLPWLDDGRAERLELAALLHDIGRAIDPADAEPHGFVGARFLDEAGLPGIAPLVAHHSGACFEAAARGMAHLDRWVDDDPDLLAVLTYLDRTTGPTGEPVSLAGRRDGLVRRYGEPSVQVAGFDATLPEIRRVVDLVPVPASDAELLTRATNTAPRPPVAADVVAAVRAVFEPVADPERARGAAAYMRDQFVFLGLATPLRRRLARTALAPFAPPTEAELGAVAHLLWEQPEREFAYVGCDYLRAHIGVASAPFLATVAALVTDEPWWDTVDILAAHAAGPLVRRFPSLAGELDRWVAGDDLWLARTAILHQLTWKADTDAERLFRYCRLRATDREFFVRKAIGWALRQYAATAPDAVAAFVEQTPELSGLSVREAMKGVVRARADSGG